MENHGNPDFGIQRISKHAEGEKDAKEEDVEAKEDVRDVLQPLSVVGEVMQEDGDNACSHVYSKPSLRFEKGTTSASLSG